jgi:crotonobetainyl-CoA:carnitine CoA-transferase CaiB-like acyl-CoA transferase
VGLLRGIRVVDATRLLPGGYATMLLSDLGAEVIKVEQPGLGDYMRATPPTKDGKSPVHETANRNKLSVGIDLKSSEGKEVMRKLIGTSDVFVEGFRPGVMNKLGFSFAEARKINPRIVYCSISAFGQKSRLSSMPGHDINFQSMAGTLGYHRSVEVPQLQLGDMVSGMFAVQAILAALVWRRRAVYIDVPIVQSLLSWMVIPVSAYLATGVSPVEGHSLVFGSTPYYNLYRTSDHKYVAVAAIEPEFWRHLLEVLGVPQLEDKRFGTPAERREVTSTLRRVFASKTRDEWGRLLMNKDTCATPVLSLEEAIGSDWAKETPMLIPVKGNGVVVNSPLRGIPPLRRPRLTKAPSLGENTPQVLRALGYSRAEISELKARGVVQ